MKAARPQLDSRADIDAQVAAMRRSGRHIQAVQWQGQAAWLKLGVPQPPAWRYQLLAGMARLLLPSPHPSPQRGEGKVRGDPKSWVSLVSWLNLMNSINPINREIRGV